MELSVAVPPDPTKDFGGGETGRRSSVWDGWTGFGAELDAVRR